MKKIVLLAIVAAITSCSTTSEVMPIGKDTYIVGANVHGGFMSDAEVTGLSVRRANEFCSAQGKQMEAVNTRNSGTQGWTPQQSQLTFKCVPR